MRGEHAVVCGASIAGLLAARVLADLEATLNGEITSELSTLAHARAA